jgi:hypothetical protein
MSRLPRYRPPNESVVYQCQLGKLAEGLQLTSADREVVIELLKNVSPLYGFELYAFCVTPLAIECVIRSEGRKPAMAEAVERIEAYFGEDAADKSARGTKVGQKRLDGIIKNAGDTAVWAKVIKMRLCARLAPRIPVTTSVWASRYNCSVVEPTPELIVQACAEVDLRVKWSQGKDPDKSAFCSFGAAALGDAHQRGIYRKILAARNWTSAAARYRKTLDHTERPPRMGRKARKGTLGNLDLDKLVRTRKNKQRCQIGTQEHYNDTRDHLREIKKFHKRFGHSRVPVDWDENPGTAAWVRRARQLKKRGKLPPHIVDALNRLDFPWVLPRGGANAVGPGARDFDPRLSVHDANWQKFYLQLKELHATQGHFSIPDDPKLRRLAAWVTRQRHQYRTNALPEERRRRLDAIGFHWRVPTRSQG